MMRHVESEKKKKVRKRFVIETIMLFFIILSPFIFKLHGYLPRDPEATLEIFGLTIDRNGFPNIRTHIWFLLGKIIPLYLLIIWFFTCKQWWNHLILIPILMYAFQTFEVIFNEGDTVDSENLIWLLPVCMVVIPLVYFIRMKLVDKYVHGIDLEAMEAELNALKEKANYKPTTDEELEKLKSNTLAEIINRKLSTRRLEAWFQKYLGKSKN